MTETRDWKAEESSVRPRILILEGNEVLADLVETRLRIEGMSPTTCMTGREALAALSAVRFDAIILDVTVDDADRDQILRKIRAKALTSELPVILLTPKQQPSTAIAEGFPAGESQTVTKPFTGQELMRKLRLCLVDRQVPPIE